MYTHGVAYRNRCRSSFWPISLPHMSHIWFAHSWNSVQNVLGEFYHIDNIEILLGAVCSGTEELSTCWQSIPLLKINSRVGEGVRARFLVREARVRKPGREHIPIHLNWSVRPDKSISLSISNKIGLKTSTKRSNRPHKNPQPSFSIFHLIFSRKGETYFLIHLGARNEHFETDYRAPEK